MTLRYGGWAGALTGAGAGAIVGLLVGPGGAAAGASGGFLAGGVSGIIWGGLEGFIAAAAEDELAGVAEGASKNGLKAGAVAGLAAGAGKALGKAIEKGVGLTFWQRQMGAGGTLTLERIIVHCPPALAAAVNGVTIVAQGGLVVLMKKMSDGELKMPEEAKKLKVKLQSYQEAVVQAQKEYPQLAGQVQDHHITPKFLGGAVDGPTVPLDRAYHQKITNAFRQLWPYGSGQVPTAEELRRIMKEVYRQFPLPPGYTF